MKPFVVGDYIDDGSGHEGTVMSIEIIYTRLLTANNEMVCIPNGKLADSPVTNLTHQETAALIFLSASVTTRILTGFVPFF